MKNPLILSLFLPLTAIVLLVSVSYSFVNQPDEKELEAYRQISKHVDENEKCFSCHGETVSEDSSKLTKEQIFSRQEFYQANHKTMSCMGCHADPESPNGDSKEAALSRTCSDCHQHIRDHEKFQFAAIDEEYLQSVHYQEMKSDFSCWKCHNPHTYKITARNSGSTEEIIKNNNEICLKCHADAAIFSESQKGSETDSTIMHYWLPEKAEHFRSIRCIDCHTKINENLLVAHLVLPEDKAVRQCSECHEQNSILLTTLYKSRKAEAQTGSGLFNSVVLKDVYVMGGNRSKILNLICIFIMGFVFTGVVLHMVPRIIRKNKN